MKIHSHQLTSCDTILTHGKTGEMDSVEYICIKRDRNDLKIFHIWGLCKGQFP